MNKKYRKEVSRGVEEGRWTFLKVFPTVILAIFMIGGFGFLMRSLGLLGGTVVERKVFENSYQRSESIKSQIATDEAALAQIKVQLRNPELEKQVRLNLEAQAAAIEVRLDTARRIQ